MTVRCQESLEDVHPLAGINGNLEIRRRPDGTRESASIEHDAL
jgi:hypothetical protein